MQILNASNKPLRLHGRRTDQVVEPTQNIVWASVNPAEDIILCEDDNAVLGEVTKAGVNVGEFFDSAVILKIGDSCRALGFATVKEVE